jgi:hypothetical protein
MAWIAPVIQAGMGLFQRISASQAAKNLPDRQTFQVSPEMRRSEEMALRRAEQGMSAAERAAFEQGMARRTGAAERAMRNLGMSGVASGISNIFNIDAMNQMAAQSESMRRAGEQQYASIAGQIQNIADQETRSFNDMLLRQQMALGQAGASGMKNITGGLMNLATGDFGGGIFGGGDSFDPYTSPLPDAPFGTWVYQDPSTGLGYSMAPGASASDIPQFESGIGG